ncbi:MAG TPA: amidohydrolase family protein [Micromonosporaceae bacterium]
MFAVRASQVFDGSAMVPGAGTVLVRDGRIAGITPAGAPVPDGCPVIDFDGATVLPGLIDAHVHLCADSGLGALDRLAQFSAEHLDQVIEAALRANLAAGVTTVRDLGDRHWAVLPWRERADPTLPTVLASGPPLTSPGGHCWNMGGEVAGPDALRAAVAERVERRVDVVKIMASGGVLTPGTDVAACQFTLDELRAVTEQAHAAGLPVTAHAHALAAIRLAVEAGVDGIEHCSFVTESGHDVPEDLVRAMAAQSIAVCPTLGQVPGMAPQGPIVEQIRRTGLTFERRGEIAAGQHAAGVTMISGTDAGIGPAKPHGVLPHAVARLVEGGVSSADALASATSVAAMALNLAGRKGRLAEGYDADLLVVAGDPVRDVAALTEVLAVFTRGHRAEIAPVRR